MKTAEIKKKANDYCYRHYPGTRNGHLIKECVTAGIKIGIRWKQKYASQSQPAQVTIEIRNIISDAMDKLAMAVTNKGDVNVSDHVDALYVKLSSSQPVQVTKCTNCNEMVTMVSAGEFCPKCMC